MDYYFKGSLHLKKKKIVPPDSVTLHIYLFCVYFPVLFFWIIDGRGSSKNSLLHSGVPSSKSRGAAGVHLFMTDHQRISLEYVIGKGSLLAQIWHGPAIKK